MNRLGSRLNALSHRPLAVVVAIAAAGAALTFALMAETPVGRVEGQIVLEDTQTGLAAVEISLVPAEEDSPHPVRRAVTDGAGRFVLFHVAAGAYRAVAESRAHRSQQVSITVAEGTTTPLHLTLARSRPNLDLARHRRTFLPAEGLRLPIRGYVDGDRPPGTDVVHVRLFRVPLLPLVEDPEAVAALDTLADAQDRPSSLPAPLLAPASGSAPALVLERDVLITEGDREGFFAKELTFDAATPGLYLYEVTHGDAGVAGWAVVTRLALVMKRSPRMQFVAYTAELDGGAAVPGSVVRIYRGRRLLAGGTTNAGGILEVSLGADTTQETGRLIAVASSGDDATFVRGLELGSSEEDGAYAAYLYTDRPIYRPGQQVFYKGILRRKQARPLAYAVPSNEAVTLELRDPTGERIFRAEHRTNESGAFAGSTDLGPEAPTGNYTFVAIVRGERHTQDVTVASYQKPEFQITVTPGKPRYLRGERVQLTVSGEFYFGAPVAGGTARFSVFRAPDWAAEFLAAGDEPEDTDKAPPLGYHGAYGYSYGEIIANGEARLDAAGKAVITFIPTMPDDPDAPLEHVLTASVVVKDASGREASADGTVRVVQGDFRLTATPEGYVAAPNQPVRIVVSARDFEQKPVPGVVVDLETGYETWQPGSRTYGYRRAGTERAILGPDGSAAVSIVPPAPGGDLRITARARDARGHIVRARTWLWVTDDRGGDLGAEYAGAALLTDKRRYEPGETARVLINTEHVGQTALVTIEGDRLFRATTVAIAQHSTVVHIPVLAEYGPNVYLAVTYVRNKHLVQSQITLRVSIADRTLNVAVHAERPAYQPGDQIVYDIQTTDAHGHPVSAELSLGVVDESIYALLEDDPTGLREAFFPHRYNAVHTRDSLGVEYLGDTDKSGPRIVTRKRFPDTAFWAPFVRTDAHGHAAVTFTLPDSLTAWRATVTGHTVETLVGRATERVTVTKPFFVRVQTPRYLTQGDTARILALVHNATGTAQSAMVRLEAPGLKIDGAATQTAALRPGQVGEISWRVSATAHGTATVRVTAWTQATAPQFTDGVELPLAVRPHARQELAGTAGEFGAARPATVSLTLDAGAIPDASDLSIRITPSLTTALAGAVEYLVGYPYGCTEQTMDRFYPDLLVRRLLRLSGKTNAKLEADLPRMVRDSLQRLYRFQHESGAWGWWEHDRDSVWMTAYVLIGLSTAQQEGYAVNQEALKRARDIARQMAATTAKGDDRPFLLYALALAGDVETSRTARRSLVLDGLGPQGLAYVVLLDRLLGTDSQAALIRLGQQAVRQDGTLSWPPGRNADWRWDSDALMATAAALRALLATAPNDPRVNAAVRWLMLHRTGGYWESTRDTGWVLAALVDYLRAHPENAAPTGEISIRVNGRLAQTLPLSPDSVREREIVVRVPGSDLRPGPNTLTLEHAGSAGTVFYSAQLRQMVAMDQIPPLSGSRVAIRREYLRVLPRRAGGAGWSLQTEPTNNVLRGGDWVRVRLTLTVPEDLAYVLIEDPFPAGVEVTERGTGDEVADWRYWWSSVDVRDDRITFFAQSLPRGVHVIEYNLRARTPGVYRALPTFLQGMYAPETHSEPGESRVDVR